MSKCYEYNEAISIMGKAKVVHQYISHRILQFFCKFTNKHINEVLNKFSDKNTFNGNDAAMQ